MSPELVKYISHIESQKKRAVLELERAKRSIVRCDEKIADAESHFKIENGRGAKKVSRLLSGEEKPKKVILRKSETENPNPISNKSEAFWE